MAKTNRTFSEWLEKKGFTTEAFAQQAGVSYHTATRWRRGSKPKPFIRGAMRQKFPDCPIFA